jgi:1,4-dihydroxy-2-naphthoate octaprenyltransferase
VAPGLLATAILAVNNLRDRDTDMQSGKKTVAVRFGAGFARGEYLACLLGAAAVPVVLRMVTQSHGWSLVSLASLLWGIPALRSVFQREEGERLNQALGGTGRVLFIYGVLFSVGWIV